MPSKTFFIGKVVKVDDRTFEFTISGTQVVTLKVPLWLDEEIERLKGKYNLPTKSDLIRLVIAKILRGEIDVSSPVDVNLDGPKKVISTRVPLDVAEKLDSLAVKLSKKSRSRLIIDALLKEIAGSA